MSKIIVSGGNSLRGEIKISGAKNSALPILASSILSDGECVIDGIPPLYDTKNMIELLKCFGCKADYDGNKATINSSEITNSISPYELVSKFRASFLVMGPLLSKLGYTRISLPGGCAIGARPVDLHLKGFVAMGAKITQGHGYIEAKAKKLRGAKIYLDFPSVGATQNIIMAACLAEGQTVIENAATEPEIADLATFLNNMGANIIGAGTDTIKIYGVSGLHSANHTIISDRIEAGTFMVAAAITKGDIKLNNVCPNHLKPVSAKLREIGAIIEESEDSITVNAKTRFKPSDIKTMPFPGFPTDMQSQFMALMSVINGTSIITETIFENRFMHVPELNRMNANIKIEGRTAIIEGKSSLTGAYVNATDLRAGAALVLAGLSAHGSTHIESAEHIYRGYDNLEEKLGILGADIQSERDENFILTNQ